MEAIKKQINKLRNIFNYINNNKYLLLFTVIMVLQFKIFSEVIRLNYKTLLMLLPFCFLFGQLWVNSKDDKPLNKKSLLTSASIILAILFFLFKGYQDDINKFNAIQATTAYNCETAQKNIIALKENNFSGFILNSFIVDDYKKNYSFIFDKYGRKSGFFIKDNLSRMEKVNSLIQVSQALAGQNINSVATVEYINNSLEKHNKQIVSISEQIKEDICPKSEYKAPWYINIIEKIISKVKN